VDVKDLRVIQWVIHNELESQVGWRHVPPGKCVA